MLDPKENLAPRDLPKGFALLHDPALNKGTAFTEKERDALELRGLLPPHVHSQDEQVTRVLNNLRRISDPLDKFVALNALHDRNEALFFRVLCDNIDEMQPLVYTPTVGLACQKYGLVFQGPRGIFIGTNDRGHVAEVLCNWPYQAGIIVVTDGERILGLGDLGANGMGIPVGKLSLYVACAGVSPQLCLPVTIDVGTNNETLLKDPFYVGLRQRRVTGGKLGDQKILFLGAGEAATGIADLVAAAMVAQGLTESAAHQRCWLVDSKGLVIKSRTDLAEHKVPYAQDHAPIGDFLSAVKTLQPTAIIGVAAVSGTFTKEVLEEMARINQRPIVFALSNPTSQAECNAEQAYRWTNGRALFACGSPFDPVQFNGKTFVPRQGNNSYIFPGVGLGAIVSRARHISDDMFMTAAHTLAHLVTESDLEQGSLYPALPRIREVSAHIATAVADTAYKSGLAGKSRPQDVLADVQSQMYDPRYKSYV